MKKSEFVEIMETATDATGKPLASAGQFASRAITAAERAGVTWDPEEPEVLWASPEEAVEDPLPFERPIRFLADGSWQFWLEGTGVWRTMSQPDAGHRELGRRLLEEHKQQEALDDHNDKQGGLRQDAPAVEVVDPEKWRSFVGDHQDRLDAFEGAIRTAVNWRKLFDMRLTKIEEDLLLVRGQAAHVDEREAADYLATQARLDALELEDRGQVEENKRVARRLDALEARPVLGKAGDLPGDPAQVAMHYAEWKKLVAVYELWGPEGTLRERLANEKLPHVSGSATWAWFTQLRSELLALPVEEFPL